MASGVTLSPDDEILRRISVILGTPKKDYFMRRDKLFERKSVKKG